MSNKVFIKVLAVIFLLWQGTLAYGINIADPTEIAIEAMLCHDDITNSAWLKWEGHEMLVTLGYSIGEDLKVSGITKNAITLHAPQRRKFYILYPKYNFNEKSAKGSFWVENLSLQKTVAMIATSLDLNYFINVEYNENFNIKHEFSTTKRLISHITRTHKKLHLTTNRNCLILQSSRTNKRAKRPRIINQRLLTTNHRLNSKCNLVALNRPLNIKVQELEQRCNVFINWENPDTTPISCSFKNTPIMEILRTILPKNSKIHIGNEQIAIK